MNKNQKTTLSDKIDMALTMMAWGFGAIAATLISLGLVA